jgi:hypothetical protein
MVSLMADNACYPCSATNRLIYIGLIWLILFVSPALAGDPIEVAVSLKVDQITNIDQKAENFGAVVTLVMEYNEPALAVKPGEEVPSQRMYQSAKFTRILAERGLFWPATSFHNLQGRMDYQNRFVVVDTQGNVTYFARFTATFQAPDFNFRHFPLDRQEFHLKLDSILPLDQVILKVASGASGLGDHLGEEEWILENAQFGVDTHDEFEYPASRFFLSFEGSRHLAYYLVRILIPVLIIIMVSWFSFFLNDYTKRVDLAGGNLLLFIAFNFTIANDLPRLGYITLMDTFMLSAFAITGFIVLASVWLRRLENQGKGDIAGKVDVYGVWVYPLVYVGAGLLMFLLFYGQD